jgi:hypothetical protein
MCTLNPLRHEYDIHLQLKQYEYLEELKDIVNIHYSFTHNKNKTRGEKIEQLNDALENGYYDNPQRIIDCAEIY